MKLREFNKDNIPEPRGAEIPDIVASDIPVDLEIGAGVGLHSIQYSQNYPNRKLLAIERTRSKFEKFFTRFQHHELTNLFPVHDEAISWLTYYGEKEQFSKVFILYPNPEPRNSNQRWGNMPFLGYLKDLMIPSGSIEFRTNIESYREELLKNLPNFWNFEVVRNQVLEFCLPETTHFEKKYLDRGERCFQIEFRKNG